MKKILIIDENILDYENEIKILKTKYDVEAVAYVNTARYLLEKTKYDLIVLDIMMPPRGEFGETSNKTIVSNQ